MNGEQGATLKAGSSPPQDLPPPPSQPRSAPALLPSLDAGRRHGRGIETDSRARPGARKRGPGSCKSYPPRTGTPSLSLARPGVAATQATTTTLITGKQPETQRTRNARARGVNGLAGCGGGKGGRNFNPNRSSPNSPPVRRTTRNSGKKS